MKQILRLVGGFGALVCGALIALPLPEFGVPLILLGTRLLGNRFKWARIVNSKVDETWKKTKAWLRTFFRR